MTADDPLEIADVILNVDSSTRTEMTLTIGTKRKSNEPTFKNSSSPSLHSIFILFFCNMVPGRVLDDGSEIYEHAPDTNCSTPTTSTPAAGNPQKSNLSNVHAPAAS